MKRQFIVTARIDGILDRKDMETIFCGEMTMNEIRDIFEKYPEDDLGIYDIEDFCNACNDQMFDGEVPWVSCVTIDLPDSYTPNRGLWYYAED